MTMAGNPDPEEENFFFPTSNSITCGDPTCEKCNPHLEGQCEDEGVKDCCFACGGEINLSDPIYIGTNNLKEEEEEEEWICGNCVCQKCKKPPKITGKDEMHSDWDIYECFDTNGLCNKCNK